MGGAGRIKEEQPTCIVREVTRKEGVSTSTSIWHMDPREETAIVLLWQVQTPSLVPDRVIQLSIAGQREWFEGPGHALFRQKY